MNTPQESNVPLRLVCVLAHPDDESLGTGGMLARYAAEGVETYLIMATGGERGWLGDQAEYPGPERLAHIRKTELSAAAAVLGLREVTSLGYRDGELDQADPQAAVQTIVAHLRRIRPHVVVTFDPYGAYGHPDHIAICQLTTAAVAVAANPLYQGLANEPPHQVLKFYYLVATTEMLAMYQAIFGDLVMCISGQERRAAGWEAWAITTWLDVAPYWAQVWRAVACHRSQLPGYGRLLEVPEADYQRLWSVETYYRVFSLVNGGSKLERSLLEGLESQVSEKRYGDARVIRRGG